MKALFIFLLLAFNFSLVSFGQKFGYFDSKFVLSKMPEYKKAQDEINKASTEWQKEVEEKFALVDKLRKEFSAEEILLSDDMKKERLAAIAEKDKLAKERQTKVFGFDGLLFLKRQELVKPVQDKLYDAVEKVCKQKKLAIMYDKSADIGMIYTDTRHDYTDYILEELGLGDKNDSVDNKRDKDK
jgi:outer membrane protein